MPTFFGLTHEYMEQVYEQFFLLKYHANWSLLEVYNLPIGLRRWFFNRLVRQKEEEAAPAASQGSQAPPGPHGP